MKRQRTTSTPVYTDMDFAVGMHRLTQAAMQEEIDTLQRRLEFLRKAYHHQAQHTKKLTEVMNQLVMEVSTLKLAQPISPLYGDTDSLILRASQIHNQPGWKLVGEKTPSQYMELTPITIDQ